MHQDNRYHVRFLAGFLALLLLFPTALGANENIALDNYSCQEFLADAAAAKDGSRLLKSMMMIAWATGYAAGRQPDTARADAKAIQLIAATLGDACRKHPAEQVAKVIARTINEFSQTIGKR